MRSKTVEILKEAQKNNQAVGAFNTSNLEITQAIVRAAHQTNKACIVQITPSTMKYADHRVIGQLVKAVIEQESNGARIGFHLDHGKSFDDVVRAIEAGVDSVMIDASVMDLKENIEITKRVVDYAHQKGVSVQAELGKVPYMGREDQEIDWEAVMTDPEEAQQLVMETGVDALAVGIGNAHGFFREREEPDWERLKKIRQLIPETPLILHGASDWKKERIAEARKQGICCCNIDTDIRLAFMTEICHRTQEKCDVTDPRKVLGKAREAVQKVVEKKMNMFWGE